MLHCELRVDTDMLHILRSPLLPLSPSRFRFMCLTTQHHLRRHHEPSISWNRSRLSIAVFLFAMPRASLWPFTWYLICRLMLGIAQGQCNELVRLPALQYLSISFLDILRWHERHPSSKLDVSVNAVTLIRYAAYIPVAIVRKLCTWKEKIALTTP